MAISSCVFTGYIYTNSKLGPQLGEKQKSLSTNKNLTSTYLTPLQWMLEEANKVKVGNYIWFVYILCSYRARLTLVLVGYLRRHLIYRSNFSFEYTLTAIRK